MSLHKEKSSGRKKSRCQVQKCLRNLNVSMHSLPKKLHLKESWIKRLKLCFLVSNPFYVCGEHFQSSDFIGGKENARRQNLHWNAVPSMNLPTNKLCLQHKLRVKKHKLMMESSSEVRICSSKRRLIFSEHEVSDREDWLEDDEELATEIDWSHNDDQFISSEHEVSDGEEWLDDDIELATEIDWSDNDDQFISSEHEVSHVEEWLEDDNELAIEIDWSRNDEVILDHEDECSAAGEVEAVKCNEETFKTKIVCEDKCIQTNLNYETCNTKVACKDACIQANLNYEEVRKRVTLCDLLASDSDLQSWTGLPSYLTLNNIVNCVQKISSVKDNLKKLKATSEMLTVIVMTKLKTNLSFKQLSCLFSLRPDTLATYFDKYTPMLRAALSPAIFWPTKEQVFKNLPKCFLPDFSNCRAIMDCTEFPIQSLKSLESRIKNYSNYKGCQTGKTNITCAPAGIVTHVSSAWGGKVSDNHIVGKEKILEKFSRNDGVMVDKGYHIEKDTSDKGIQLYRPPILDKPQHTRDDAIYNTKVATSRIHVERVIQRVKIFEIFKSKMNRSLLKHIDNIMFICCAITNLSPPVLADDKF